MAVTGVLLVVVVVPPVVPVLDTRVATLTVLTVAVLVFAAELLAVLTDGLVHLSGCNTEGLVTRVLLPNPLVIATDIMSGLTFSRVLLLLPAGLRLVAVPAELDFLEAPDLLDFSVLALLGDGEVLRASAMLICLLAGLLGDSTLSSTLEVLGGVTVDTVSSLATPKSSRFGSSRGFPTVMVNWFALPPSISLMPVGPSHYIPVAVWSIEGRSE